MKIELPEELLEIGRKLLTQDNACTDTPVFVVAETRRISGMDPEYTDKFFYWDSENQCEPDDDELAMINGCGLRGGAIPEPWEKVWYVVKEFDVQWFFTADAAEDYIKRNSHRHSGPLHISVDWGGRNNEWKAVRNFLMAAAKGVASE